MRLSGKVVPNSVVPNAVRFHSLTELGCGTSSQNNNQNNSNSNNGIYTTQVTNHIPGLLGEMAEVIFWMPSKH